MNGLFLLIRTIKLNVLSVAVFELLATSAWTWGVRTWHSFCNIRRVISLVCIFARVLMSSCLLCTRFEFFFLLTYTLYDSLLWCLPCLTHFLNYCLSFVVSDYLCIFTHELSVSYIYNTKLLNFRQTSAFYFEYVLLIVILHIEDVCDFFLLHPRVFVSPLPKWIFLYIKYGTSIFKYLQSEEIS